MIGLLDLYTAAQPWLNKAALHMQTPYAWVGLFSASSALLGSLVLALKGKYSGWGWLLFAFSNVGWIVFAKGYGHWFFLLQQIGFSITSAIGIWRYLLQGEQRAASFVTFRSREFRPEELHVAIRRVTHFHELTLHRGGSKETDQATTIFLDNGQKLLVWHDAATVQAMLEKGGRA